jgi:chaperone BCS1
MFFNEEGDDGSHGFQMMGMINALKTGDVHTDMMIAMLIPFVLKVLFNCVGKFEEIFDLEVIWSRWFEIKAVEHERFISHSTTTNVWGNKSNLDEDTQNSILLKAIKMYLHQVVKLDLMSAHLDLTGMEDKNYDGYYDDGYDSDDDNSDQDLKCYGSQKTLAGQLSRYKIINRLPNNEWHEIGNYGDAEGAVRLRIEHQLTTEGDNNDGGHNNSKNKNSKNVENITFHFLSPEKGAIDAFIDTAYHWYLRELRKMDDNSRYFYEMKLPDIKIGKGGDCDDNASSEGISYKRYRLSEEKSFDSLFFREKESLLALINHFSAKSGKYSIRGYPHKLGVLLHGPPGTGKTSLIKALAHYTGRSIVNVPLSRVSTNSELMSVFFDRKYHVEGSYVPIKLGFKDVIYVMEDCDAASKVVKRRDGQKPTEAGIEESISLPMPKSLWRLFLESTSSECRELVALLLEKSKRLKEQAEKERPKALFALAKRLNEQPALGLTDQAIEDPTIAQACTEAMELADQVKEQRSKLDEILKSHADMIKELLDSGAEVNDDFVGELLGETQFIRTHTPQAKAISTVQPNSSGKIGDCPFPMGTAPLNLDLLDEPSNGKSSGIGSSFFKPNPDALSLSGLLNVLDGVVDTPGRIVILTSNHPEMLDPALIRPGRVDKMLMLGYMETPDIVQMLELYYQSSLSSQQVAKIRAAVEGGNGDAKSTLKLTPAQIEQLAAEHDDLDEMIRVMEGKRPVTPTTQIVEADSRFGARV